MKFLMFILLMILVFCCLCPVVIGGAIYYLVNRRASDVPGVETLIEPPMMSESHILSLEI